MTLKIDQGHCNGTVQYPRPHNTFYYWSVEITDLSCIVSGTFNVQ